MSITQVVMEFFLIRMAEVLGICIEKVIITLINQILKSQLLRAKAVLIINRTNSKVKRLINQAETLTEIKIL